MNAGIPYVFNPATQAYEARCPRCGVMVGYITEEAARVQYPRVGRLPELYVHGHVCEGAS